MEIVEKRGLTNTLNHLSSGEWASVVSQGLGTSSTTSAIAVNNLSKVGKTYIFTDSGLMCFPSSGPATSMWAYLHGYPGWKNVVVHSCMGVGIFHFTRWLEAIMFRHGGGPEWWRWSAIARQKGVSEQIMNEEHRLECRGEVWRHSAARNSRMPGKWNKKEVDELYYMVPIDVAVFICWCGNDTPTETQLDYFASIAKYFQRLTFAFTRDNRMWELSDTWRETRRG